MGVALLCFLLGSSAAFAPEIDAGLSELLTQREYQKYRAKPRYKDRIDLFQKVFDRQVRAVRVYLGQKRLEKVLNTLQDMGQMARYAMQEPSRARAQIKELQSKQVKKLEIRLRKLLENLDDLRFSVPFEYRTEFDRTKEDLEKLRDQLLRQLFGEALAQTKLQILHRAQPSEARSFRAPETRAHRHQVATDDCFTDAEYEKLQQNQELVKRVEVFLEIAESRLLEFERRMSAREREPQAEINGDPPESSQNTEGQESHPEEENPLFFFDYWELVRSYERAIDGIMVNVDDRMEHRPPSREELKETLEKLQEKVTEFIPKLAPIKQLAERRKDETLYNEIRKSEGTSEIAQKGSQHGLQNLKRAKNRSRED